MSPNNNVLNQYLYNNNSNHSFRIKLIISIALGFICLVVSQYGIILKIETVGIEIPWFQLFPILISISFGWRFGLISAISGAAFIPFFLWPENGWANFLTSLLLIIFYTSIGFVNNKDSKISRIILYKYALIVSSFFIVLFFSNLLLYNKLLAFNTSYWQLNTLSHIEQKLVVLLILKDFINLLILTIVADIALRLPFVRLLLGMDINELMKFNYKILLTSIIISLFIWLSHFALSYFILTHTGFSDGHLSLALIVILAGGFVAARVIINYTERQLFAFEDIKRKERYIRFQFDKMPIAYIVWDENLHVLSWNPAAERLFGYSEKEAIGKSAYETIVPLRIKEKTSKIWYDLKFKGIESQIINENITKQGNTIICNWTNSPIKDKKGNVTEIISMVQDISEQKQAEETLKESEANLNSLINNRNDAIWSIDTEFKFITLNAFFKEEYLNFFDIELKKGMDAIEILGHDLKSLWKTKYELALSGQKVVFEFSVKTANEPQFYEVFLNPIIFENTITGVSALSVNITERKNTENALIESEQLFSNIFKFSPISIIITLPYESLIVDVNTVFLKELGYSREEVLGKTTVELGIFNDLADRTRLQNILKDIGFVSDYECLFQTKSGKSVYGLLSIVFIQIKGISYQLTTVLNINDRKQAENKLWESEKSYLGLFNSVTEAIYIQDENGVFLDVNAGVEKMYGYSREEIIGKTPEFLAADGMNDSSTFLKLINKVFITGEPQQFEFWGKRKNQEVFPKDVVVNKGMFFGSEVLITTARDISQRKKIEKDLQESEFFFRESQRVANVGSYKVDFVKDLWESSEVLDQIFGIDISYNRSNKGWLDIVHPEDRSMMHRYIMQKVLTKTRSFSKEYRIKRKSDGETRWVIGHELMNFDENGNIITVIGTVQDITEQKISDEIIRKTEANLSAIIENTTDSIWAINTDYEIIYINNVFKQAFKASFGIDLEIGSNIVNAIPEHMRSEWKSRYDRAFNSEQFILEDRIDQGFAIIFIELSVNPIIVNGIVVGASLFSSDITERKKANEALRISEERFKVVTESAEEWIWEVDKNGLYTYSNPIVETILGYRPDEIVGKMHFFDFFEPETLEQYKESVFNMFENITVFKNFENINIHKNGNRVIFKTSGSPIYNVDGELIGYRGADIDISIQKRIEIALLESEEKYRLTFMTSPDSVNINTMDGVYVDINEGYTSLTGYTREDVIGVSSININIWYFPEDRKKLTKLLLKNGFVSNLESVFRCKDGSLKTALMSARIIQINNTPHILSITRDITERKILEDTLVESEKKYRKLFERSNDAIFIIDKKSGRYLDANKSAERLTGYSQIELKNLTTAEITPIDSKKRLSMITSVNKAFELGEIEYSRADGTTRHALLSIIPLSDDKVYGIAHDITERKQYEDALGILSSAVDQSPVSVVITDTNGLIEYVNPKYAEVTGYNLEEVIGKSPSILKSGYTLESEYKTLWKTITSGEEWRGVFNNIKKNGDKFWESALISPIFDEHGVITHYLAVKEDITDKKEAERKILSSIIDTEEKERNRFSRELHDGLGPLLSTIKLYFQWISETNDPEKKVLIIEKGEKNINEAIETIREVSNNLSPRTLSSFGVIVALRNFIDNINHAQKLLIEFNTNTENRFDKNVEIVLFRVTSELINNTIKYAQATKSIVNINSFEGDGLVRLTYVDNGIGFDLEEVLKNEKGLGLVNIKQRVKTLDGKFRIDSSVGKGVYIEIELPILKERIIA